MTGILWKQGQGRKIEFYKPWRQRLFVLDRKKMMLHYFIVPKNDWKSIPPSKESFRGEISVQDCRLSLVSETEKMHAFRILHGAETLTLACSSYSEKQKWMSALSTITADGAAEISKERIRIISQNSGHIPNALQRTNSSTVRSRSIPKPAGIFASHSPMECPITEEEMPKNEAPSPSVFDSGQKCHPTADNSHKYTSETAQLEEEMDAMTIFDSAIRTAVEQKLPPSGVSEDRTNTSPNILSSNIVTVDVNQHRENDRVVSETVKIKSEDLSSLLAPPESDSTGESNTEMPMPLSDQSIELHEEREREMKEKLVAYRKEVFRQICHEEHSNSSKDVYEGNERSEALAAAAAGDQSEYASSVRARTENKDKANISAGVHEADVTLGVDNS
eukprot:CAMPEP_0185038408 /NCGR_PEP_ID=MMETSP1103-20130426/34008_1 /TAXON_ID=36769 /ORGANISM="Paraphysomonas bandaiensis, Strain Caron Lab Isolate" /LENGTH=389 /DNA_ID=CAMNT_0027576815 /DNA_START=144 /DNA_END=1313 /DNA_ORIENTATION=+